MFGADSATPAPCTSTIAATASAPVSTCSEKADSSGHAGSGTPCGMSPWSSTWATSAPVRTHTIVGTASATTRAERREPRAAQHDDEGERADAGEQRGGVDPARVDEDVPRLLDRDAALGLGTR